MVANSVAMHTDNPLIFISYRSVDEPWAAILLRRELATHFGPKSVFLDTQSIKAGEDFRSALLTTVVRSALVLAVMGRRWLTATRGGQRLIDDERDWVRQELVQASTAGVRVVPVLIGNIRPPRASDLPADVELLAHRQFLRIRPQDSRRDIEHVITSLELIEPRLRSVRRAARRRPSPNRKRHRVW